MPQSAPTNYIIEDNLNFFDELNKLLAPDSPEPEAEAAGSASPELCLISNEPLDEVYYIELECGHKFNYKPLCDSITVQKGKYKPPPGQTVKQQFSKCRLRQNQIQCPYCRAVQDSLLPYVRHLAPHRVNGVNSPAKLCKMKHTCDYQYKSGKNKGQLCQSPCYFQKCSKHLSTAAPATAAAPKPPPSGEQLDALYAKPEFYYLNTLVTLKAICKHKKIKGYSTKRKPEIVAMLEQHIANATN